MAKHYKTLAVEEKTLNYFDDCVYIYRKAHPEMRDLVITRTKILNEIIIYYLQKTEKKVEK
jgi:hypothetical protein